MRRYFSLLGMVVLVGGIASFWMTANAAEGENEGVEFAAPGAFEADDSRPINDDATVDDQVRPVAGGAPVSTRRTSGLTGRLQSLRKDDNAASASSRRSAPPRSVAESLDPEVDTDVPAETVGALPSVLKRANTRRSANVYSVEESESVVESSPSDAPAATTRPVDNIRVAPSRARATNQATTPATEPAPTSTINTTKPVSRSQTLTTGASASLAVETAGPKAMTLNKPAAYTVTVLNQGVNEAADVFVAVNLPAHVELSNVGGTVGEASAQSDGPGERIVWKIDRIAGRGQEKLTLELIPRSPEPIDLGVEWTMAPPTTVARVDVLEPKLTMALKGPKDVLYGDTAVYQIIIANPGSGDAEDVVVDLVAADGGAGEAKKLGTIAAGQQKIVEVSMNATKAGPMTMHFTAHSGGLNAEASEEVMVRRANLELAVEGPQLVFAGSEATYKVQITNTGDAPAEAAQIGALLPEGSEYLGGINGAKPKNNQLIWSAGTLAPGASASYEFTLQMTVAGAFEVPLQTQAGDVTAETLATTRVEAVADLKLTVNDPQGPKPVGEEVTYEVTLVNRGTKAARKVQVVVNFSEGIDPVSVEGGTAEIGSGQAMFSPILSIDAGATHKLKITAKASQSGSHVFRAEVRCNDPETRLASEQTTRFFGSGASSAAKEPAAGQFVPSTSARPMLNKRR